MLQCAVGLCCDNGGRVSLIDIVELLDRLEQLSG
jgi:hypothetical protein